MTTHRPDDASSGDALRDPRFDAAWRKLSREEPPPALDAAIRAAAHRVVGAAPRSAATHVPSALRPQRWWWPLAAAATIGAIVIGLLQLAPPDRVAPAERAVVSDVPATAPQSAPREAPHEPATPPKTKQQAPMDEAARPSAAKAPTPAQRQEAPPARKDDRPRSMTTEGGSVAPRSAPPPTSASAEEKTRKADANAVAPAPLAEPFPADVAKRAPDVPAASAKTASAKAEGALSREQQPSGAAPPPSAGAAVQDKLAAPPPAAMGSAQSPAPAPPSSAMDSAQSSSPGPPSASYAPDRRAQAPRDVQRAASTATSAAVEPAAREAAPQRFAQRSEPRAKEHAPLSVADWIALIRKLRDDGRTDEAAKELASFRREHPDHERLLPPDLRDWQPPAK